MSSITRKYDSVTTQKGEKLDHAFHEDKQRDLLADAPGLTPFEKVVADEEQRRTTNAKREKVLKLRQARTQVDVERIIARGGCLTQYENDLKLEQSRDPLLKLKWTPLHPHPLPTSYELFDNERELQRIGFLPPENRVMAAVAARRAWCVEALFIQGCPIHSTSGLGFTPLHVAAANNDTDTVRVLLNMKANVNAASVSGATPLSCAIGAARMAASECTEILRAAGGLERRTEDIIFPASILDVPLPRPQRAIDDDAAQLGRMVFTGQF